MQSRIKKDTLYKTLSIWNSYLKRKVHLIACGGTAITLLDLKESTKDIDFIIPNEIEYRYLVKLLKSLGYSQKTGSGWTKDDGFIFGLYVGKTIFTTELLESPLKEGNNIPLKEYAFLYLGILNYYDLIISKIFRSSTVDIEDCLVVYQEKQGEINFERLKKRFLETSSYDISDEKNIRHFEHFENELKNKKLIK